MKSVLVIDDQEDIIEILEIYIEGHFEDLKVLKAFGGYEAISILDEEDIDAIICDFRMPEGDGRVVYNFNVEGANIPFAWHSATFSTDEAKIENKKEYFVLDKPVEEDMLVDVIHQMLAVSATKDSLYRKIKISILRGLPKINFDIFYKINDEKYVTLANEDDQELSLVLEKYDSKGVEYLYVKPHEIEKVFQYKSQILKEKIEKSGTPEDVYFVTSEVIDHFYQDLQDRGLSEAEISVANKCVNKCLKQLNNDVSIKKLMSDVIDKENYISTHSLLLVHIANAILSKYPEYEVDLEVISMTAVLHDLKIPNSRLARIRDFTSDEFKALSHSEQRVVLSHGVDMANDLESASLDEEVLALIKKHELFGNDIKRGSELSEQELLFYISHEVAHYLTEEGIEKTHQYLLENKEQFESLIGKKLYSEIYEFLS